jgi:serine/threonine protein kinase
MGVVFRAHDETLGRVVALKVMKEEEAADEEARARFLREARLAASLAHPGIVAIYDVGSVDDTPYIAMEWIDGKPLRSLLGAPLDERLGVIEAIATIVAAAHEQGVIHRDLKPSNVLIDAHGAPRLLDFGIAKRTARAEDPHPLTFETRDDVMLGTPSYMPPEQLVSAARVDARADQFAWGVIAYELLSGSHPRSALPRGSAPFPMSPPSPLATVAPEVPRALTRIVDRALSPKADDRYPKMRALLADWKGARAGREPAPHVPSSARRSPRNVFVVSALVVFVVGAIALGAWKLRSSSATRPTPERPSATPANTPPIFADEGGVDAAPEPLDATALESDATTDAAHVATNPPPPLPMIKSVTLTGLRPEKFRASADSVEIARNTFRPYVTRCLATTPRRPGTSIDVRFTLGRDGRIYFARARPSASPTPWVSATALKCIESTFESGALFPFNDDDGATMVITVTPD